MCSQRCPHRSNVRQRGQRQCSTGSRRQKGLGSSCSLPSRLLQLSGIRGAPLWRGKGWPLHPVTEPWLPWRLSPQDIGTWLMAENMCPAERNPFFILCNYVHTAVKLRSLGSAHSAANHISAMKVSPRLLGMNETQVFYSKCRFRIRDGFKTSKRFTTRERSSLFVKKTKSK